MKIFLAGATGAIGRRLVPRLVAAGHEVVATTRHADKAASLRAHGSEPVVLDVLDARAVMDAVVRARPEAIVHQVTSIPVSLNLRRFDDEFALTNRLRTVGLQNLIAAARAAGARRVIAQSYTSWPNARNGGRIQTEDDPLESSPPKSMSRTLEAIRDLEATVTGLKDVVGIALRYGSFYGPGTSMSGDDGAIALVRKRKFPIVGDGGGIWSFIHIDDAAEATRLAIEHAPGGIYNIVDDEPAEVSVWLPELVRAVGAPPPRHVPGWLGRLFIGDAGMWMMTVARGSSNAKAKRILGWQPKYATWREGFRTGLSG